MWDQRRWALVFEWDQLVWTQVLLKHEGSRVTPAVTSGGVGGNMERWGSKGSRCLLLSNIWSIWEGVSHILFMSPVSWDSPRSEGLVYPALASGSISLWAQGSSCCPGHSPTTTRTNPWQADRPQSLPTIRHRAQLDPEQHKWWISFLEIPVDVSFFDFSAASWQELI